MCVSVVVTDCNGEARLKNHLVDACGCVQADDGPSDEMRESDARSMNCLRDRATICIHTCCQLSSHTDTGEFGRQARLSHSKSPSFLDEWRPDDHICVVLAR
jgi:hypothetical protein